MMNTMFNFIGSERQIEWAKKIVSGPYDFLMYIASTAEEEIKDVQTARRQDTTRNIINL